MRGRKSIRLKGYDYSQAGAYFITICTKGRKELLGAIRDGKMCSSAIGRIVQECWDVLPSHYPNVQLDAFVVMPDHAHGIIVILDDEPHRVREGLRPSTGKTRNRPPLSEIVRAFKSFSARRINEQNGTAGQSFWQRGYYDHIIRNERSLERIREYISTNPSRWQYDRQNTSRAITDRRDPRDGNDFLAGAFD